MYSSNPTISSKMWHKVFFKWSTAGLDLEFSFSEAGFHTKVKEPSLPRVNSRIHIFLRSMNAM